MAKVLLILLIGLAAEAAGVVFLKKGVLQIGELENLRTTEVVRLVKAGVTNPSLLVGVLLQALFFVCLLGLMARSDVSFLWPLTALGFVLTTLAALIFLGEKVSAIRWAGVIFIVIGSALVSYSEHPRPESPPAAAQEPSSAPQ